MCPLNVARVRDEIPFLRDLAYFDTASIAPPPLPVVEKMNKYFLNYPVNAGAGATPLHDEASNDLQVTRTTLARLIGAKPGEIAFAKNTTEALNMVANGLEWATGDEVITTTLEHQSNQLPWFRLREKGVVVHVVRADSAGFLDPKSLERLLNERTRLVTMVHVSNILGTIQPVAEIGRMTQERKVLFLVDGAQSVGRMPVDVRQLGCDFFAGCGRKSLMGPQGTAFLYVREPLITQLQPSMLGSHAVAEVGRDGNFSLVDTVERLEAGTWNAGALIGMGVAAQYVRDLGVEAIAAYIRGLEAIYRDAMAQIRGVRLFGGGSDEQRLGIIAWTLEDQSPNTVAKILYRDAKAVVAAGSRGSPILMTELGCRSILRTSFHCFNTQEEVDRLLLSTARVAGNSPGKSI